MTDRDATAPIATRVLFEDDRIRVWEMVLEPGEDSGRHEHPHDYVVVLVEGDRVGIHEHRTSAGEPGGYREADVTPGQAFRLRAGGIETAVNAGSVRYRDIEIEFLT
jgi:beta-alanine degradation protein BauB